MADPTSLVSHLLPFYVREHSKRILRGALWNDSKFLANLNIMDYSVVVAVDSTKNELIVGIVGERQLYSRSRTRVTSMLQTSYGHTPGTSSWRLG